MHHGIENIIIVGIIPGPKEPSSLNSYLCPLVDELLDLWDNRINVFGDSGLVTVRAALLCAACDTPAARKLRGFLVTLPAIVLGVKLNIFMTSQIKK